MKHLLFATFLALAVISSRADATNLITNGGFENGIGNWSTFIPDESKASNCRFDVVSDNPHSGTNCARLQSDDFGRFSIGGPLIPVHAGEHYDISVWIRADSAAQVRPKAPGFVIRLYLAQGGAESSGGHMFIGPGNRITRTTPPDGTTDTLPTTWTHIEAVVEIPPGVDAMGPGLFSWWTKGSLFADDFSVEKVEDTPTAAPQKDGSVTPAPASK